MSNIPITKSDPVEFYEKDAGSYDGRRWATDAGKYIDSVQKQITLQINGSWRNRTVLEVGTGTGRFSMDLAKQGAHVIGVDTSLAMLHIAKSKSEHEGLSQSVGLMNGNAVQLPFKDATFDACICVNVLNHIPRYICAIEEIGRVLKPKGVFIGNFTNMLSCYFLPAIMVNLRHRALRSNVYTCWHTISQVEDACFSAGLKIEEMRGQLHFPGRTGYLFIPLLKKVDHVLRSSPLTRFAPTLFVRAVKM